MNDGFRSLRPVAVSMLLGVALLAASLASGAAAAKSQKRTIYAVAIQAQYVNYVGKIAPAHDHNPFNADAKLPVPQKGKGGAIPGNSAFFRFKLYSSSDLKQNIGTAWYSCSFTFNQHATCDAYYDLNDGTLFASGPVDFRTAVATLAVTGGTSTYLGASGEVVTTGPGADPAAKNETRLDFILVGH